MKLRLLLLLSACAWSCAGASSRPDNAAALRDIQAGRSGSEVVVQGPVTRLMGAQAGPAGVHERFAVQVSGDGMSRQVLVADNISIAQAAPLHSGDIVTVKGELAFNSAGPVIHWTHRDPRLHHRPGFIEVSGKMYE
jgi:Protein of unknown function (DUF3465)